MLKKQADSENRIYFWHLWFWRWIWLLHQQLRQLCRRRLWLKRLDKCFTFSRFVPSRFSLAAGASCCVSTGIRTSQCRARHEGGKLQSISQDRSALVDCCNFPRLVRSHEKQLYRCTWKILDVFAKCFLIADWCKAVPEHASGSPPKISKQPDPQSQKANKTPRYIPSDVVYIKGNLLFKGVPPSTSKYFLPPQPEQDLWYILSLQHLWQCQGHGYRPKQHAIWWLLKHTLRKPPKTAGGRSWWIDLLINLCAVEDVRDVQPTRKSRPESRDVLFSEFGSFHCRIL